MIARGWGGPAGGGADAGAAGAAAAIRSTGQTATNPSPQGKAADHPQRRTMPAISDRGRTATNAAAGVRGAALAHKVGAATGGAKDRASALPVWPARSAPRHSRSSPAARPQTRRRIRTATGIVSATLATTVLETIQPHHP